VRRQGRIYGSDNPYFQNTIILHFILLWERDTESSLITSSTSKKYHISMISAELAVFHLIANGKGTILRYNNFHGRPSFWRCQWSPAGVRLGPELARELRELMNSDKPVSEGDNKF
jgi:hypothetical protein